MIRTVLNVIAHGLIESGQVIISADEETGLIDASESVVVGLGPFSTERKSDEEVKIDPKLLLSKSIGLGMTWEIGPVKVAILSDTQASIEFAQGEDQLSGKADIDLTGEYIKILGVNAVGKVSGMDVQLELKNALA